MALTFTFSTKIVGTNGAGGSYGGSVSRISGAGGQAGSPLSAILNAVMVASFNHGPASGGYAQADYALLSPSGWTNGPQLFGSDEGLTDSITSVDLSGSTAIAGDPSQGGIGAAYVLVRDSVGNWTQQQKLVGSDSAAGDSFGVAVCISSNTAAIGATGNAANTGAVYIFNRVAGVWSQIAKLVPADLSAGDLFGSRISLLGSNLFVSTLSQATNTGAVYWYQLVAGTWNFQQKLTGPAINAIFGQGIAFDGITLVIGASGASSTGLVYLYQLSGASFVLTGTLIGSDSAASDQFGYSVDILTPVIVVGAIVNATHGAVYVFQNGVQVQKIVQSDPTGVDHFGSQVKLAGGSTSWIVVGATGSTLGGAAYFFSGPSLDPTFKSQLAFQGVRRVKRKERAEPAPFNPKSFTYTLQVPLTTLGLLGGNPVAPIVNVQKISDYDFDLYDIKITYQGATGPLPLNHAVTKLWIYDMNKQQISNAPVLDLYYNDAPGSKYVNGAIQPALHYARESTLRIDVFNLITDFSILPVTMTIHLVGMQRIPCY